jgi:hypothetical protein
VQRGAAADAYSDALLAEHWDTAGPDVVRITCDGREQRLVVATAPTPPLSAPIEWVTVAEGVVGNQEEAIARAEQFLNDWSSHAV